MDQSHAAFPILFPILSIYLYKLSFCFILSIYSVTLLYFWSYDKELNKENKEHYQYFVFSE